MKELFTLTLLLFSIFCNAQTLQKRETGSFSGISASSGIIVEITQGAEENILVKSSNDNYTEKIKTVVEDGVLKIFFDNTNWKTGQDKNLKLQAFVTFKLINRIVVGSGARLNSTNTTISPKLNVALSSGAQFSGDIKTAELELLQNSGAVSKITGSATTVNAVFSSGAVCTSPNLFVEILNFDASSGAVMKVSVNSKISAKLGSGALLSYKGGAVVKKRLRSGGHVRKFIA